LRFPEFSGEWKKSSIREQFELYSGNTPSRMNKNQFDGSINWITSGELKEHYISDTKEKISEEAAKNNSLKLLPVGTFVIAIYGLEANGVRGTCSITTRESTISQACMAFTSKMDIQNEFLYSWYKKHGNIIGIKYAQGTKQQNLSYDIIERFNISYPCMEEQKKLIRFISLIDQRIATQNKIIEDLKKLKSAITQKLLNDRVLLETRISLGEVCELKNGYAFKSSSYCRNGKYKILTIANVQGNRYISTEDCKTISYLPKDLQEHQVLRENDILISMTGNVGRVSLCNDGHYLLNQRVGLLAPKIKEVEFLFQVLASEHFEQSMIACGQGAAQMNIGKSGIDGYMLPFSRKSDNMNHIAKVLQAYDNCINTNVKLLDYLILQKQYLLSQMFI